MIATVADGATAVETGESFPYSFIECEPGALQGFGSSIKLAEQRGCRSRRTNGATQTFRRPSLATNASQQKEFPQTNSNPPASAGVYVPPHLNSNYHSSYSRNGASAEGRYSKEQLLHLFESHGRAGPNIDGLYVDGWKPDAVNGVSNGGWGKRDDQKEQAIGPEICWDLEGKVHPLSLIEMNDEEKQVHHSAFSVPDCTMLMLLQAFQTSVNSPLKPLTQNNNKDGAATNGAPGRRTSLSQAQSGAHAVNPPSSRPGNRRRDSADLLQGVLNSPVGNNRFSRDESHVASPPSSLLRRRTDLRDSTFGATPGDRDNEGNKAATAHESSSPFGALKRTATGPASSGLNGPSSPWSNAPQSAGFAPMGAFGNFSLGGQTNQPLTPNDKKTSFGSLRGESRFRGLMNPDNTEESKSRVREKASVSSLERLAEGINEQPSRWSALSSAHLHFEDDSRRTGSAALGGDDVSPPQQTPSRTRNPDASASYEDIGFSALGMSSDVAPFRELMQRRDPSHQMAQPYGAGLPHEPMSPTNTNPYQSPEAEKAVPGDIEPDDSDLYNMHYGPGSYGQARGTQSQMDISSNDRSRTSSAGASRGFPNLGLGNIGGVGTQGPWSAAPGVIGTSSRAQAAFSGFGDSMFGSLGELQSPSHANSRFFDPSSVGAGSRSSRMGSLFPNAMQDQMRGEIARNEPGHGNFNDSQRHAAAFNAPGFGRGLRETDNSSLPSRLENLIGGLDIRDRGSQNVGSNETAQGASHQVPALPSSQPPFSAAVGTPSIAAQSSASSFGRSQEPDNTLPASQQRQMVMPDRMRWIYRDPQGNTQGPWSGLEMHDWYKAGFFSPELQVKKLEDNDYEPLAQLIRRIGNSREPFLVPQIGIPHGSSTQPPSATPAVGAQTVSSPSIAQSSSAQPPFASSFPSFGTTLTAEQQNALERRKQEEQYLMARQKEHLAQQQVMIKQMHHMQGGPGQQLHHHSSAHSLQSQPSYGSITSPSGYQPSPAQGPIRPPAAVPGLFDPSLSRAGAETLSPVREDDMGGFIESLHAGRSGQIPFNGVQYNVNQSEGMSHPQQMANMLQERARLQREQEQYDLLQRGNDELRGTNERLDQFHMLRGQMDEQQSYAQAPDVQFAQHQPRQERFDDSVAAQQMPSEPATLSLSEQVQKAASAQTSSPWANKEITSLPQPFPAPPPPSSSPLPAPAAQRRQNVADTLALESQSRTQTPSAETPSAAVAPWARATEPTETAKGPSLKEIQAMEARKAAQQEEIAAAARKALAAKQETANTQTQQQQVAPAPGLPISANWASGAGFSPAAPSAAGWPKPKTVVATPAQGKKTLAQIQKEEETRKLRAAVSQSSVSASTAAPTATAGGKRYADLASKAALSGPQISTAASNAWTTVGAGGKVKTPTTPSAPITAAPRTASASGVAPVKTAPKPAVPGAAAKEKAQEEFQKWIKATLGRQLSNGFSGQSTPTSFLAYPVLLPRPTY